jgi:hypothetical protein
MDTPKHARELGCLRRSAAGRIPVDLHVYEGNEGQFDFSNDGADPVAEGQNDGNDHCAKFVSDCAKWPAKFVSTLRPLCKMARKIGFPPQPEPNGLRKKRENI